MIYPPSNKYPFKMNEAMCEICLKSLIKAPERHPPDRLVRSFGCLILKFLMQILTMYLSAGHYIFVRKFLHFKKNAGIYRQLQNINQKKLF